MHIAAPQSRPPETWQPAAMYPHLIGRTQLANGSPGCKCYLVASRFLLVGNEAGDVGGTVPFFPTSADMEDLQDCFEQKVLRLDKSLTQRRRGISTQTAEANTSTASTNGAIT